MATAITASSAAISAATCCSTASAVGIGAVLQLHHRPGMVVIAHHAAERHIGTGGRVPHRRRAARPTSSGSAEIDLSRTFAGTRLSYAHRPAGGRRRTPDPARGATNGASTAMPSRTPPGEPGSVTTSASPIMPATPRDSTEVGTRSTRPPAAVRRCPESAGPTKAETASGVTSVGVSPVPPVVSTNRAPAGHRRPHRVLDGRHLVRHDRPARNAKPQSCTAAGQQRAGIVRPLARPPTGSSR